MKTNEKELHEISDSLERVKYNLGKMKIFNYNTLDEADSKHERIKTDITVEIWGTISTYKVYGIDQG